MTLFSPKNTSRLTKVKPEFQSLRHISLKSKHAFKNDLTIEIEDAMNP